MPQSESYWEALADYLFSITKKEIVRFAEEHSDEQFYGFFFDCNSAYGEIFLCLNTEQDHAVQLEKYVVKWPDQYADPNSTARTELRWNPGDWLYQGFESDAFDKAWASKESEVVDLFASSEDDEAWHEVAELFMAMVGSVAIRLEDQGAFEPLGRASDFQVMWADHDELWEESLLRMSDVRKMYDEEERPRD